MSIESTILESTERRVTPGNRVELNFSSRQLEYMQELGLTATQGLIRTSNSVVDYLQFKPTHDNESPTVITANGLCAARSAYIPFAIQMAAEGHAIAILKPPRTQDILSSLHWTHLKDVLLLQAQASWAVMKVLDEDQYDLYGHSTGAAVNLRLIDEKASRVRSLLPAGGAGMNGRNSVMSMLLRTTSLGHHTVARGRQAIVGNAAPHLFRDTIYHAARRPDRTIREAVTVAVEDSQRRLERVAGSGTIKIGALLFDNDNYYSSDSVLATSGHLFDAYHRAPGASHVYPQDHPREHAQDVANIIDQLHSPAKIRKSA